MYIYFFGMNNNLMMFGGQGQPRDRPAVPVLQPPVLRGAQVLPSRQESWHLLRVVSCLLRLLKKSKYYYIRM